MATITFTIPNAVATELNSIAVKNGFGNAKEMVVTYLRGTIKASRDIEIRKSTPEANISDVVIS